MKSLNTIQKLSKIGKVLSKIAFIFSVIGFCGWIAGLLSLSFGNGSLIKIGGVTLHGLISEEYGYNIKSITATISGWMIVCAGEAVLADSDIMQHYPYTFDEARVQNWIDKNMERYCVFGFGLWAVCLKITGVMWYVPWRARCDEFMYQLNEENENTEIMVDYESRKNVILKELLPDFWGKERYSNNKTLKK